MFIPHARFERFLTIVITSVILELYTQLFRAASIITLGNEFQKYNLTLYVFLPHPDRRNHIYLESVETLVETLTLPAEMSQVLKVFYAAIFTRSLLTEGIESTS